MRRTPIRGWKVSFFKTLMYRDRDYISTFLSLVNLLLYYLVASQSICNFTRNTYWLQKQKIYV